MGFPTNQLQLLILGLHVCIFSILGELGFGGLRFDDLGIGEMGGHPKSCDWKCVSRQTGHWERVAETGDMV